mmetsp:Transcript_17770/g.17004  ORF Transcript_17770/g.17004 Transcript_17770/m.17004 type:complete len:84 (+) Transcript_17770:572-823(+)
MSLAVSLQANSLSSLQGTIEFFIIIISLRLFYVKLDLLSVSFWYYFNDIFWFNLLNILLFIVFLQLVHYLVVGFCPFFSLYLR